MKCWSIQYEPPSPIHIAAILSSVPFDLDETFRYSDNIPPDPFFNFASVFYNNRRLRRQNSDDLLHPIRYDFFHFFTVCHRRSFSHCNAFDCWILKRFSIILFFRLICRQIFDRSPTFGSAFQKWSLLFEC